METIAFLNPKGGSGRTSSVFHLSAALARLGHRVLLIDNDPCGSLTQSLWGYAGFTSFGPSQTVAALIDDGLTVPPSVAIRPTGVAGVDILPGSERLQLIDLQQDSEWPEYETSIRRFVSRTDYDFVLIDCPRDLGFCTWAAMVASDRIVVPIRADDSWTLGLEQLLKHISRVQAGPNSGLSVAGYLMTMFDRRICFHATVEEVLRDQLGAAVFATTIPYTSKFLEAAAKRKPIGAVEPTSAGAKAMESFARELLSQRRIRQRMAS